MLPFLVVLPVAFAACGEEQSTSSMYGGIRWLTLYQLYPIAHQLLFVMVLGILSGACSRFRYGKVMNMSKKAIYDQLISDYGEKFTKDEARYAVDHLE